MSKATVILFLSIYLLTTTETHQLLRLPVVFQHYLEHGSQSHELSFSQFLSARYFHETRQNENVNRNMQLPFKKMTQVHYMGFSLTLPLDIIPVPSSRESIVQRKFYLRNDQFFTGQQMDNIFQPPREA